MESFSNHHSDRGSHPAASIHLEEMFLADQEMREKAMADQSHTFWDDTVDLTNVSRLKHIIEDIGWPTVSRVGKVASHAACLLARHADHDLEFQKNCLSLMMQEVDNEVEKHEIAYLNDRIRVNSGKPQIYGTQMSEEFDSTGAVIDYRPQPIEHPETVDARRAEMGLNPLSEYIHEITKKYYPVLLPTQHPLSSPLMDLSKAQTPPD